MLKSIALRRVLIYFGLSSAGVAGVSQLELDQSSERKASGTPGTTTTTEKAQSKGFLDEILSRGESTRSQLQQKFEANCI